MTCFFADFHQYSSDRRYKYMIKVERGGGSFAHFINQTREFLCMGTQNSLYFHILASKLKKNSPKGVFGGSKNPNFPIFKLVSWPYFSMDRAENHYAPSLELNIKIEHLSTRSWIFIFADLPKKNSDFLVIFFSQMQFFVLICKKRAQLWQSL